MMRSLCLSVLVTLAGVGLVTSEETPVTSNPAWRSLPLIENDRIADGWTFTGYGGFEVADGALRTVPDARGLGLLYYEKEKFGNCRIRIVFKTEKPESNSGFYLRIDDGILNAKQPAPAERKADGSLTDAGSQAMEDASAKHLGPWYAVHHGYEVQICDSADPSHGTGAIYSLAKTVPSPPKPGVWRTMIVTLDGDKIFVDLDGKQVTEFDSSSKDLPPRSIWYEPEREPKRPESGYIGLQTHDPGDIVEFKEVSVQPL